MSSGIESTSFAKAATSAIALKLKPKTTTLTDQNSFAKAKQSLPSSITARNKEEVAQLANQLSQSISSKIDSKKCSGRPCNNHITPNKIPLNEQSPAELVFSWVRGSKGNVDFSPNSKFSHEFSKGQGAKAFEKFVYNKFNGSPSKGDVVTNYDYKYKWGKAILNINMAVQVVGSFQAGTAYVGDNKIYFSVKNTMGANSLLFGRQLSESGLPSFGSSSNDLKMTISWIRPLQSTK